MSKTTRPKTSSSIVEIDAPFSLPNERLRINYILRQHGNITDKRHVAYGGKLDGSYDSFPPKMSRTSASGSLISFLSLDEQAYLEKYLALDDGELNPNNKVGYLRTFEVKIGKEGIGLDLSSPEDYLKYKVLLSYTDIVSPDIFSTPTKLSYKYEVVREKDVNKKVSTRVNYNRDAYMLFGKMEDSREQLAGAYRVITGKRISADSKIDWLIGQVGQLIEADAKRFVEVIKDDLYQDKLFLELAIDNGQIVKTKGLYYTEDGIELSVAGEKPTLINAIQFLNNIENQDLKLVIQSKMK